MNLEITQFMRPNGRPKTYEIIVPDECKSQVDLIQKNGCRITAEQMMNGEAAQYISNEEVENDFDICVTACGKEADTGLLAMIERFNESAFQKWFKSMKKEGKRNRLRSCFSGVKNE